MAKRQKSNPAIRRVTLLAVGVILVAVVSAYATAYTIKVMKQAAHYTTLDLRPLQIALVAYSLESHLTGGSRCPESLDVLVKKHLLRQNDLDRINLAYNITYTKPAPGAPADTVLFRAVRKPAAIIYTVSGKNRIETSYNK
ncbi:MAG: hypothetical protein ABI443_12015 [Chthoniobacterales bacterium]